MSNAFAAAARLQSSIVHALILQDMSQRYARTRLGALAAIIEPVVFVGTIYLLRYYLQGRAVVHGLPLALFIATGFIPVYSFRIVAGTVMSSMLRKASTRLFPQITSLDVVVAQGVAGMLVSAAATIVAFTGAALITDVLPADPLTVFAACWLILALGAAFGLVVGVALRRMPALMLFVSGLMRINMYLAGIGFLGTEVPPKMIKVIAWNPTFHCIELLREGWLHGYVSPFADWLFVIYCIIGLLAIGLPLERLSSRNQLS